MILSQSSNEFTDSSLANFIFLMSRSSITKESLYEVRNLHRLYHEYNIQWTQDTLTY